MLVDVVRETCTAGAKTAFVFRAPSVGFLVKNFTNASVLVCLGEWNEAQSVLVAAQTAETVSFNADPERNMTRSTTATVIVQAQQTGIVEVIRDD